MVKVAPALTQVCTYGRSAPLMPDRGDHPREPRRERREDDGGSTVSSTSSAVPRRSPSSLVSKAIAVIRTGSRSSASPEQIEDVLAEVAVVVGARELAFDRTQRPPAA